MSDEESLRYKVSRWISNILGGLVVASIIALLGDRVGIGVDISSLHEFRRQDISRIERAESSLLDHVRNGPHHTARELQNLENSIESLHSRMYELDRRLRDCEIINYGGD